MYRRRQDQEVRPFDGIQDFGHVVVDRAYSRRAFPAPRAMAYVHPRWVNDLSFPTQSAESIGRVYAHPCGDAIVIHAPRDDQRFHGP